MYQILLWDLDGTLLDFAAAENYAIKAGFRHFQLGECTDEMVARYSAINLQWWERLERGEVTKQEVLVGRYRDFSKSEGFDESIAEEFNREYQLRLGDKADCCDDSKEIVTSLIGKVKQYIVSNGTTEVQHRKLAKSGLDKLMDGIFLSEQLGCEKPSIHFFEKVFEQTVADIPKEDILIIGDSLTSDIRGGNNAGIKTCWYNPGRQINHRGVHVDYEIQNLHEIYQILNDVPLCP